MQQTENSIEIPNTTRLRLLMAAWAVGLLAPMLPGCLWEPKAIQLFAMFFWLFPTGLLAYFVPRHDSLGHYTASYLIVAWIGLIAFTYFTGRQRRRARFFIAYTILFLLLIFNAVGCHIGLKHASWGT